MRLSDVPLMFHSKCPQSDPSDLKRMAGAIWFTAAKTFLQTRTVCCKSIFCGCPRRLGWCHWRLATPDKTFIRFLFEHVRFSKVSVDSLKSGMCKETLYVYQSISNIWIQNGLSQSLPIFKGFLGQQTKLYCKAHTRNAKQG